MRLRGPFRFGAQTDPDRRAVSIEGRVRRIRLAWLFVWFSLASFLGIALGPPWLAALLVAIWAIWPTWFALRILGKVVEGS